MINSVRCTDNLPDAYGHSAGFVVDQVQKRPCFNLEGKGAGKRWVSLAANGEVAKTAAFSILPVDDGKLFAFDSTTSIVGSLPAAASCPGAKIRGYVKQLTVGAGHAFSPVAADTIIGNGFTGAANKDVICTGASDRVGDIVELESLGGTTWLITNVIGTWAREA